MPIGERIKQARMAAGLSLDELAARLGYSLKKQTLSNYERSKTQPTRSALIEIAGAIGVKPAYFYSEPQAGIEWKAYRKHSKLPKAAREQIQAYAEKCVESHLWLQNILYPNEITGFPTPTPVNDLDDAEAAANKLRSLWKLGYVPIDSIASTIESNGGIIVEKLLREKFDGLCGWANSRIPIIVVNSDTSDDRKRMNLAHELGHLAMKCPENLTAKEEEEFAFRFGAAFLVPAEAARKELGHPRYLDFWQLALLKQKWGLSMQAWIRRARDLNIVSSTHYKSSNIEFRKNGWHRKEPIDFGGQEKPYRFRLMVLRALTEGIITKDKAKEICPDCLKDLEEAVALPSEEKMTMSKISRLPLSERHKVLRTLLSRASKEREPDEEINDWSILETEGWGEADD